MCKGDVFVASEWQTCAGCYPKCGGEVWQSCAGAVQAVQGAVARSGKGVVRAPVLWVLRWRSLAKMLCKSGKGQLVQGAWEPASPRTVHPWFQD